jgi:hypothetical protein
VAVDATTGSSVQIHGVGHTACRPVDSSLSPGGPRRHARSLDHGRGSVARTARPGDRQQWCSWPPGSAGRRAIRPSCVSAASTVGEPDRQSCHHDDHARPHREPGTASPSTTPDTVAATGATPVSRPARPGPRWDTAPYARLDHCLRQGAGPGDPEPDQVAAVLRGSTAAAPASARCSCCFG